MAQQTAVARLEEKLKTYLSWSSFLEQDFEQAKEIENEQIMESWKHGNLPTFLGRVLTAEEYYNETYGK